MTPEQQDGLARYVEALQSLNAERVASLGSMITDDYHFIDPFNDIKGRAAGLAVFADIFKHAQAVSFVVTNQSVHANGAVLHWTMSVDMHPGFLVPKNFIFTGLSDVHVAADGRVSKHYDYWDSGSQFYAKLPGIGGLVRAMIRRLAVKNDQ